MASSYWSLGERANSTHCGSREQLPMSAASTRKKSSNGCVGTMRIGIDVVSAETDTVIFFTERMPDELEWFVRDIKDLCPEFGEFTETSLDDWRQTLESEGK